MQSRRALRALKGLVRLQALIRGQAVRRQTADTLRGLESLMRIQARHRSSAGADDDDDALLLRRGRELYAAAVHVSSHIHTPLSSTARRRKFLTPETVPDVPAGRRNRGAGGERANDWRRTCTAHAPGTCDDSSRGRLVSRDRTPTPAPRTSASRGIGRRARESASNRAQ